jgi:hypothetical protein
VRDRANSKSDRPGRSSVHSDFLILRGTAVTLFQELRTIMATIDAPVPVTPHSDQTGVVRMSINLAADVADILRGWAATKAISVTEAVRRAIAVWNFVETEKAKGNRLAVIEGEGSKQRVREVVLI